ncbi:hypothetical protein [Burkholderia stagnalis]|uniref:hypothetical protein n=1 Tax=Burkholderia stagnalis TaxID=1503054 RepID=UPI000F59A204|nr:hypothetical protein [Burkholderia stagnalis]
MKIFWSWQSDTSAKVNKNFVKTAIQNALSQVSDELGLTEAERPEIDHDTKDAPGLVSIVDTIFKKIEQAEIFIGDVTFVGQTEKGKLLPNANVMIELGHALTSIGHERIILVANKAFGGEPEDLPFDLRHRRGPITYTLKSDATQAQHDAVLDKLTKALLDALRMNLSAAIEERDAAFQFDLYPSRSDDRSTWLQAGDRVRHQDSMFAAVERDWVVPDKPRSYMRLAPANWTSKPTRAAVLAGSNNLFALGPWRHGNYGANQYGVIKVGSLGNSDTNEAIGVAQWFNKTGELWGFNNAATFQNESGRNYLCLDSIVREWDKFLCDALAFFKGFGAEGPIRVEAGVVGLKDVYWPNEMWGAATALEDEVYSERVYRAWTRQEQLAFLADLYNDLHDAFGKPHTAPENVPRYK